MPLNYFKPVNLSLRNHPEFNEVWLRERIVDDPSILGLGDLEVKDIERSQPHAGRLDLLLRDPDSGKRYEVELMLGALNESHIIRTIEYWDIERKRYPQYDHCAVIVAENITSRFLNVIGLFNSVIPMIAIQLNALQIGENIVLDFVKVLDEIVLGLEEDDGEEAPLTDRAYWESRGTPATMAIADSCLEIINEINPKLRMKYNKYYIGLAENDVANNFVIFQLKKQSLRVEVRIGDHNLWKNLLEEIGLEILPGRHSRRLMFRITADEFTSNRELLSELFAASYAEN